MRVRTSHGEDGGVAADARPDGSAHRLDAAGRPHRAPSAQAVNAAAAEGSSGGGVSDGGRHGVKIAVRVVHTTGQVVRGVVA